MGNDSGGWKIAGGIAVVLFIFYMMSGSGTTNRTSSSTSSASATSSRTATSSNTPAPSSTSSTIPRSSTPSGNSNGTSTTPSINSFRPSTPTYADSRWPTNNSTLLAVPEYQRWYNAGGQVGTYCTIVGPVKQVFQDTNSYGMPIFVDIGERYPGQGRVQIVIWADYLYQFEDMLYQIDHGGAWIEVTGYLGSYNGIPQFNVSETYIECRIWTGVS